jgi:hypothetical protein
LAHKPLYYAKMTTFTTLAAMDEALTHASDTLSRIRAVHQATLGVSQSAVKEATLKLSRLEEDNATYRANAESRKQLLASVEEARVNMETELWCVAAALEEKQRFVVYAIFFFSPDDFLL